MAFGKEHSFMLMICESKEFELRCMKCESHAIKLETELSGVSEVKYQIVITCYSCNNQQIVEG